jgi:exonuclease SbcC
MRPLNLELYGFTCYREPQPPLDFTGMSLFAIAGPTGAGKSTILDGILYALFGMVPRIGKQGVGEFISHGRDVLSVCLDFSVRGSTYRVTRRVKRSKKDQFQTIAALAELRAGEEKSIADTVKAVDAAVTQMLGLDFDAFTQTVILPQNQFARFLQSKPKDQRQILQRLLRHTVYDRMRAEAERRKGLLERDLTSKDEQLGHLSAATPESLDTLATQLAVAVENRALSQAERAAASKHLQDIRTRRELTVNLEKCRTLRAGLNREAPTIGRLRGEVAAARRAALVAPMLTALEGAQGRLEKADEELRVAREELQALRKTAAKAESECQAAEVAAADCESLKARLQRHHEIVNDVQRRPTLARDLATARERSKTANRDLIDALATMKSAATKSAKAVNHLADCRKELQAVSYDAALYRRLTKVRNDAARGQQTGNQISELVERNERLDRQAASIKKKLAATQTAYDSLDARYRQARAKRQAAESSRVEGIQLESASVLRKRLVVGEPCPVCEHIVAKAPRKISVSRLPNLEAAVEHAAETEQQASVDLRESGRELERAKAKLAELLETTKGLNVDIERKRQEQLKVEGRLMDVLRGSVRLPVADWFAAFDKKIEELERLSELHQDRESRVSEAQVTVNKTTLQVAKAQSATDGAQQAKKQADADVERLAGDLDQVNARINAVTSSNDPIAERRQLEQTIKGLEKRMADARESARAVHNEVIASEAKGEAAERTRAATEEELSRARADLNAALSEHGFESTKAAREAMRPAPENAELDRRVRDFEQQDVTTRQRLTELEHQIAGREVDAAALMNAEDRDGRAQQTLVDAVATVSRLDEQLQTLRKNIERAQQLTSERTDIVQKLGTTGQMAADLRNDRFQEYLLEEAFKGLVAGASTRLHEMSRRYTIEWRDSEFYVLDHDNAGERRRAETLSGGETFIASLCLALQLSDEVLQASGAIRMDSLFIDEGFGSLDAQSLSEVTDALENLRQEGDRVVGIISHLPELTARLPGCIRVDKGMGESKWVVERVG